MFLFRSPYGDQSPQPISVVYFALVLYVYVSYSVDLIACGFVCRSWSTLDNVILRVSSQVLSTW